MKVFFILACLSAVYFPIIGGIHVGNDNIDGQQFTYTVCIQIEPLLYHQSVLCIYVLKCAESKYVMQCIYAGKSCKQTAGSTDQTNNHTCS